MGSFKEIFLQKSPAVKEPSRGYSAMSKVINEREQIVLENQALKERNKEIKQKLENEVKELE